MSIENILSKLLFLMMVMYFASLTIFKTYNYQITYVIDVLMVVFFIVLVQLTKGFSYKINFFIRLYFIFILFCLMSSLWSVEFYQSFFRSFQLSLLLINMIVIYNSVKIFKIENTFLYGALLGSLVNYLLLLGIIHVNFDVYTVAGGARALGTLGNANMLAIVMLISIFLSIVYMNKKHKINKFVYYYLYINMSLAMYSIFLSMSKKGIIFGLILILAYILLLIKEPRKLLTLLIFISLLALIILKAVDIDFASYYEHVIGRFKSFDQQLLYVDTFSSTGERMFLIDFGLQEFQNKPLFGYGIATFSFLNERGIYAHNNYIELLVDVGIVGTVLYYYIYFYFIFLFIKIKDFFFRNISLLFIFILMAMDVALVSYGTKLLIYALLFLSLYNESNIANYKLKDPYETKN